MESKQVRALLKSLREEIDMTLGAVLDNNPDALESLKLGHCTFTPDGAFWFKLEGVVKGGKSKEASQYESLRKVLAIPTARYENFQRVGTDPGLALPPLGTQFSCQGEDYVITGANTGEGILAKRLSNGKTYTFKPEAIVRLTAAKAAA